MSYSRSRCLNEGRGRLNRVGRRGHRERGGNKEVGIKHRPKVKGVCTSATNFPPK